MSIWGRGLRPLSVCCVSLLRGRGSARSAFAAFHCSGAGGSARSAFAAFHCSGAGGSAPRGQSLLRSFLATHSFPPRPPDEGPIRQPQRVRALIGCRNKPRGWRNNRRGGSAQHGAVQHVPGGTGREGVRSEERAEQRLAPGGGAPCPGAVKATNPCPCPGTVNQEIPCPGTVNQEIPCPGKPTWRTSLDNAPLAQTRYTFRAYQAAPHLIVVLAQQRAAAGNGCGSGAETWDYALHRYRFVLQRRIRERNDHLARLVVRVSRNIRRRVDPSGRYSGLIHQREHSGCWQRASPGRDQSIQLQLALTALFVRRKRSSRSCPVGMAHGLRHPFEHRILIAANHHPFVISSWIHVGGRNPRQDRAGWLPHATKLFILWQDRLHVRPERLINGNIHHLALAAAIRTVARIER